MPAASLAPRTYQHLVILAYCLAYVPHAGLLPLPVTLWCGLFWAWTWAAGQRWWRMPSQATRNMLTMAGMLLAIGSEFIFSGKFSMLTGIGMLAILLGLKPLEVQTRESALSALCLSLFLAIFGVFHSESLPAGAFILCSLVGILTLIIRCNAPQAPWMRQLRLAAGLMLLGLPLALALFVVCPRLPFGLFGVDKEITSTGLQDTLQMGDLGQLAANRQIVFRAKFNGPSPGKQSMYWRGLVLWDFDGQTWNRPKKLPTGPNSLVGHTPVSYEIHQEPSTNHWLYSLDLPLAPAPGAFFFLDYTQLSRFPLKSGRTLTPRSFLVYNTGRLQPWERRHGLEIPQTGNPLARALARDWARTAKYPEQILETALHFFATGGFHYTFNPPLLPETDFIDAFLFDTKAGYCSHFASAMAFMLRVAGIPSRIVLGYLGAEDNTVGDYLIVRQAHAHAWDEIWLPRKGWTRIDPTATVSPQRLELGPLLYQSLEDTGLFSRQNTGLRTMLQSWDAMGFYWERFVLSYGYYRQRSLLARLGVRLGGLPDLLRTLGIMLGVMLLASGAMLAFWRIRKRTKPYAADPAQQQYERFCAKLAAAGLNRNPGQGPQDFAARLAIQRPDLAEKTGSIIACYIRLRYGPPLPPEEARELQQKLRAAVRTFSI